MVWLAIYGGMKFKWFLMFFFYGKMVNVSIGINILIRCDTWVIYGL